MPVWAAGLTEEAVDAARALDISGSSAPGRSPCDIDCSLETGRVADTRSKYRSRSSTLIGFAGRSRREPKARGRVRASALTRPAAQTLVTRTVAVPLHLPTNESVPENVLVAGAKLPFATKYSPVPPSGLM